MLVQEEFSLPSVTNLLEYLEEYISDDGFEPSSPCKPTDCPAGGMEKAEVIRQRLMRGEELWHVDDPKMETKETAYDRLVGCFD